MINTKLIYDSLMSHAMKLGLFERVNGHEPKAAPGRKLSCAFWVESLRPIPQFSGLAATSALLTVSCMVYVSMLTEPQDSIDPEILEAVDALMAEYSGDFELGGAISHVDLLGKHGEPLTAKAGYREQDNRIYRIMTIDIPMVISDAWEQVP